MILVGRDKRGKKKIWQMHLWSYNKKAYFVYIYITYLPRYLQCTINCVGKRYMPWRYENFYNTYNGKQYLFLTNISKNQEVYAYSTSSPFTGLCSWKSQQRMKAQCAMCRPHGENGVRRTNDTQITKYNTYN